MYEQKNRSTESVDNFRLLKNIKIKKPRRTEVSEAFLIVRCEGKKLN